MKLRKRVTISGIVASVFHLAYYTKLSLTGNIVSLTCEGFSLSKISFLPFFIALLASFFLLILFSGDGIQYRLGEMEKENPSSDKSRNSKRGLVQKMMDKISFHRKVYPIEQNKEKYIVNPDYFGGDKRVRDYFERNFAKRTYGLNDYQKRSELAEFYEEFTKDLENKFSREEREALLNSLSDIDSSSLDPISNRYGKGSLPSRSIDGESGEGLIAVHKTDYLPNQQQIKTRANATHTSYELDGGKISPNRAEAVRQTVHFTLNGPVSSHMDGNWDNKKYAVLLPLEKIMKDKVVGFRGEDTFSFGNVPLNRGGTELIVSREAYKIMSPKEIARLKRRTGAEIITIQSEKDDTLNDSINRRIKERGYTVLDIGRDYVTLPSF